MSSTLTTDDRCFTVAPSDLSFLLRECQRCFYLKVARKIRRPASPFPGVFTKMDLAQRDFFDGKSAAEFVTGFPTGTLTTRQLSIHSQPFPIRTPHGYASIVFRGAMDSIVTGGPVNAIADFKVAPPGKESATRYSSSLHAYAFATEHPANDKVVALRPVSRFGLLCFDPSELVQLPAGDFAFRSPATWVEVERNDDVFVQLVREVAAILAAPEPPEPTGRCPFCELRASRVAGRAEEVSRILTFPPEYIKKAAEVWASYERPDFDGYLAEMADYAAELQKAR